MAYLTPPASERKNVVFERSRKMHYYEDIYGKREVDEVHDRFVDECEESSSEDEKAGQPKQQKPPPGFFKAFARPKRSAEPQGGQSGWPSQMQKDSQNSFDKSNKRKHAATPTSSIESISSTSHVSGKNVINPRPSKFLDSRSKGVTQPPRRLTPRKFGMFGKHITASMNRAPATAAGLETANPSKKLEDRLREASRRVEETMTPVDSSSMDTAAEATNDLRKSNVLDNLEDSFATLDEDLDSPESVVDEGDAPLAKTGAKPGIGSDVYGDILEAGIGEITRGNAQYPDKDVSDAEVIAVRQYKFSKTATKSNRRKTVRGENLKQAKQASPKQPGRRASQLPHSSAKTTNHRSMSTRNRSLRSKDQSDTDSIEAAERGGKRRRVVGGARNWKGDKIDTNGGIVVVVTDEEDADEYVRC